MSHVDDASVYQVPGVGAPVDGRLIRRVRQAQAVAGETQPPVQVDPAHLAHLFAFYETHRACRTPGPAHQDTAAPGSPPGAVDPAPAAAVRGPAARAVLALLVRAHTRRCQPCRPLLAAVRVEARRAAQEAATLAEENRLLRQQLAAAESRAHRLSVERDALICERDEAWWRLRNFERAVRARDTALSETTVGSG